MKCPDCGDLLRVQKTLIESDSRTRQERRCVKCGARFNTYIVLGERIGGKRKSPFKALSEWDVNPAKAMHLTANYPANLIKTYCNSLPDLILAYEAKGNQVKDAGAFLVWCIERSYPLNGYEPLSGPKVEEAQGPDDGVWQEVLGQLRLQVTQALFDKWLAGTRLVSRDGEQWTIQVKNTFARDWLENRMYTLIKRTVMAVVGDEAEIKFVIEEK